jgi:hypothetical protein
MPCQIPRTGLWSLGQDQDQDAAFRLLGYIAKRESSLAMHGVCNLPEVLAEL